MPPLKAKSGYEYTTSTGTSTSSNQHGTTQGREMTNITSSTSVIDSTIVDNAIRKFGENSSSSSLSTTTSTTTLDSTTTSITTEDNTNTDSTTTTTTTTNNNTHDREKPRNRLRRRIRSRSAPAGLNRRKNRLRFRHHHRNRNPNPLVEQHFKIDKENKVLLPGVPVHDDDLARDLHDFFNLIILVPIVVLNVLNWDWDKLLLGGSGIHSNMSSISSSSGMSMNNVVGDSGNPASLMHTGTIVGSTTASTAGIAASATATVSSMTDNDVPFVHAWTGEYFTIFFWTTVAYFLIDLIWVCVIPKCVKSPSTIIQHHLAVFVYLILPYYLPKVRFLMGVCMSVELNTWFLIARRVFNKQGFSPWQLDIPYFISVRVKLISIFFYITWIMIRCVLYPYVWYVLAFPLMASEHYADVKNFIRFAICIHAVFCLLNGKWSMQLLNSKMRQWKKGSETKIESGL